MKDNIFENIIKEKLNEELESIEFKESSKVNVLNSIAKKKKNIFSRILNYEIRIPIKEVVVVGCLSMLLFIGVSYSGLKLTAQNVANSTIEYVKIYGSR